MRAFVDILTFFGVFTMFVHGSRFHPTIHMGLVLRNAARQSYVVGAEVTLPLRLDNTPAQIIPLRTGFEEQHEYATITATSGK